MYFSFLYLILKFILKNFIPFLVFVGVFLGTGIAYNDFYAFPSPIAAVIGIISAYLILPGSVKTKTNNFIKGCGDKNIITMCIIYLLAGGFATISKEIGSVDAVVNLGMYFLEPSYYAAGVFVIASFLSLASGTSVGTIVALGPIVMGLANASHGNVNILAAALLCGAMFGDNLSIISDTTIAATQILGCSMKDKFRVNIYFALPAAVITFILFLIFGTTSNVSNAIGISFSFQNIVLILPYLVVLLLAFLGVDVFIVLITGILLCAVFGYSLVDLNFLDIGKYIYQGFTSMNEIFVLSLLTGGLAYMVQQTGVLTTIIATITKHIKKQRSALLGIGSLVSIVDAAVANNTIAIVLTGNVAKEIAIKHKIKAKSTASILDTFSCIIQGIIPYGAQILILIGFSNSTINYFELMRYSFYLYLLLIAVLLYISFANIKERATV